MYISVSCDEEYEILKAAQALLKTNRPEVKLKLLKKGNLVRLEVDIPIQEMAKILKAVILQYTSFDACLLSGGFLLAYERKSLSVFSVKEPLRLSLIQKIENNIKKKFSVYRKREDCFYTTIVKGIDLRRIFLNYLPEKETLVEDFYGGRIRIVVNRLEIYVSFNGKDSEITYYGV